MSARRIDKPGRYDMPALAYHQDPCLVPSLSSGVAKKILRSPRHAREAHPRLNPAFQVEHKKLFDHGRAGHSLLIGADDDIEVIDAKDYTTNAAKALRDKAYTDSRTPILKHKLAEIETAVGAWRAQIPYTDCPDAFVPGRGEGEVTLIWQEGDVWCRCRLDWLPNKGLIFPDLKTTTASAEPEEWGRKQLYGDGDDGFDIQAALYSRGIRKVLGIEFPVFTFVPAEMEPPYCLSTVAVPPMEMAQTDRLLDEAIDTFGWCLRNGRWPGYVGRTVYPEIPAYAERRRIEREERRQIQTKAGADLLKLAIEFQAPIKLDPPKEAAE
jgi:hypothetical protein